MALNALRISAITVLGGVLLPHGLTIDTSMPIQKKAGNTVNNPGKNRLFVDTVIEKEREIQEENFMSKIFVQLPSDLLCY